jgi:hypothetical protein
VERGLDVEHGTFAQELESAHRSAWSLAVRTAGVASALAAVSGAALYEFLAVPPLVIVGMATVTALAIGLRLPAARPGRRVSEYLALSPEHH